MFGFGVWEIAIIAGVVLLVLGPAFIPRIGKRVGDMVIGFRDAAEQLKGSMQDDEKDEKSDPPKQLPRASDEDDSSKSA